MPTYTDRSNLRKLRNEVEKHQKNLDEAKLRLRAFEGYLREVGVDPTHLLPPETGSGEEGVSEGSPPTPSPKRGSLRENITRILTGGKSMNATQVYEELKRLGQVPASSEPLGYVRSCLAQHFQRVEGAKGVYTNPSTTTEPTLPVAETGRKPAQSPTKGAKSGEEFALEVFGVSTTPPLKVPLPVDLVFLTPYHHP